MAIGVSRAAHVKFEKPGQRAGGEIVDFRVVQKTDFDTNRPLYFQDGEDGGDGEKTFRPFSPDGKANRPICQWEVTVDTGEADETGDTERRIFIDPRRGKRGTALEGKRGLDAIEAALKKVRAHRVGLEIGGLLFMTYQGTEREAPKKPETTTWTAEYVPPAGGPGTGKPVDEVPWLVGGARFDPAARDLRTRVREQREEAGSAEGGSGGNYADRVRESADRLADHGRRTAERLGHGAPTVSRPVDDEPPF
jgi:hypothetical protein